MLCDHGLSLQEALRLRIHALNIAPAPFEASKFRDEMQTFYDDMLFGPDDDDDEQVERLCKRAHLFDNTTGLISTLTNTTVSEVAPR